MCCHAVSRIRFRPYISVSLRERSRETCSLRRLSWRRERRTRIHGGVITQKTTGRDQISDSVPLIRSEPNEGCEVITAVIMKMIVVWDAKPLCHDSRVTLHSQALHDATPHLLLGNYTCLCHCWMVVFKITVVWHLTPFSVVALCQRSGDAFCLHRKVNPSCLKMEAADSSRW
jgi:hypothetical protein